MLWVELPGPVDTVELLEAALARGIGFLPGPLFSSQGGYRHCLRLACGQPWDAAADAAIRTLGQLAGAALAQGGAAYSATK